MKVVQCKLVQEGKELVCWLDVRPNLKEGVSVTLKDSEDPKALWKVISIGNTILEKSSIPRPGVFFDSDA